jgi:hypothetical protein
MVAFAFLSPLDFLGSFLSLAMTRNYLVWVARARSEYGCKDGGEKQRV